MGQSRDRSANKNNQTPKDSTNPSEVKTNEAKSAKTKKLREVTIESRMVKNQLGLTDEPIFLLEIGSVESIIEQNDKKFTVGNETLGGLEK